MSANTSRRGSIRASLSSIGTMIKEHHQGVNAAADALAAYPRQSTSRQGSVASGKSGQAPAADERRISSDSQQSAASKRSSISSTWEEVKHLAKAHHKAVNEAYSDFYGLGTNGRPHAVSPEKLQGYGRIN